MNKSTTKTGFRCKNYWKFSIIFVVALTAYSGAILAAGTASDFSVNISTTTSVYKIGDRMPLDIKFTNISTAPHSFPTPPGNYNLESVVSLILWNSAGVLVAKTDERQAFEDTRPKPFVSYKTGKIKPGMVFASGLFIDDVYKVDAPGTYTAQVEYDRGAKKIYSNKIEFSVSK